MKRIILLSSLFFITNFLYGQQPPGSCDANMAVLASTCGDACVLCEGLDGLTLNNSITDLGEAPPGFCAPQLHNTQWIGFVAGTTSIDMDIDVFNCSGIGNGGLQIGIYGTSDCDTYTLVSNCEPSVPPNTTATFNASNLTIGGIYFVVIDGSNGDICDFTIDVTDGLAEAPALSGTPEIIGATTACAGGIFDYTTTGVDGAGIWTWTIDNVEVGYNQTISVNVPSTGSSFELCVTPSNPCENSSSTVCETITISELPAIVENAVICEGETYQSGGNTYSATGTYTYTYPTSEGCTQLVEVNLTVTPPVVNPIEREICEGQFVQVGNDVFTTTGYHEVTLQSQVTGCDSIVQLDLLVHPVHFNLDPQVICEGETYTVSDAVNSYDFTQAGFYEVHLESEFGCDSTVIVELEVSPIPAPVTVNPVICPGDLFFVGPFIAISNPGTYMYTIDSYAGCDSIVTVNLSHYQPVTNIDSTVCDGVSVTIGSETFNTTGMHQAIVPSYLGCDSTINLNLTVMPPIEVTVNAQICTGQTYSVGNSTYGAAGNYTDVLTTPDGCDSTIFTNLTIADVLETYLDIERCDGETYTVGSSTYNTTGMYQDAFVTTDGCDSVVYLDLTVHALPMTDLVESICDGESFEVGTSSYTASGNYTDVLTSVITGCDSTVNLALTVLDVPVTPLTESICDGEIYTVGSSDYSIAGMYSDTLTAANGCDSIVNLDLTILPLSFTTLDEAICDGDTYSVGSSTYDMAGTYMDVLLAANGCDSTVTLNLTILNVPTTALTEEICSGENYMVGSSSYTGTGIYMDTLVAANGCDSIVTLNLTVNPVYDINLNVSVCDGSVYSVGTSDYSVGGTYQDILTSIDGCDSIVNLELTITDFYQIPLDESICEGESFSVGDSTYTIAGDYTIPFVAADGCDSFVNLALAVLPIPETTIDEVICDGETFVFGSNDFTTTGTYVDTFTAATGCDSIVTLNLTVDPVFETNLVEAICDGEEYMVGTSVYTIQGQYTDVLTAVNGCDSTINLDLTVYALPMTSLVEEICDGESFEVGSSSYTTTGIYTDILPSLVTGCDSIITLDLTVHALPMTSLTEDICDGESFEVGSSSYTLTGIYSDTLSSLVTGCDSIITLDLTVLPIPATTLDITICDGDEYDFEGLLLGTAGTYVDTLTAVTSCDSIITLNLTVSPVFVTDLVEEICDGEAFMVGSSVYTVQGQYTDVLTAVNGCDSTVNLDLTVHELPTTDLVGDICDGESYEVGTSSYTTTGVYTDVIPSLVTGCDSIITLDLTVYDLPETFLVEEICDGESYEVGTSSYNQTGVYTDILTSLVTGCDSLVYLDLFVNPVFATTLDEIICDDETYEVGNLSFSSTGTFVVDLSSAAGCDSIVTLNLITHPCELGATMSEESATCNGTADGMINFAMTIGVPPYTYNWQGNGMSGSGDIDGNNVTSMIDGLPAGNYNLQVTDSFGVEYEIVVTIEQPAAMQLSLESSQYGAFNISCENESDGYINTSINGGTPPYTYEWSNGLSSQNIQGLGVGTYILTITDLQGCQAEMSSSITAPAPLDASFEVIHPACYGEVEGAIRMGDVQGGVGPYLYSIDGQAFTSSAIFSNLETGAYQIRVQDANGCIWQENYEIVSPPELLVDLGDDEFIKLGESVQLSALTTYPVDTAYWSTTDSMDCLDPALCLNPEVHPNFTTTYQVTVIDENGCRDFDEITVFVDRRRNVYIPNVFSPNEDGHNDYFSILTGPDVRQVRTFQIFNRWGENVYEGYKFTPDNDPSSGWNGRYRGKYMNPGVYVYYIEVEFVDGEVMVYSGDVVLMR